MTYSAIASKENNRLMDYCSALECLLSKLREAPMDDTGHRYPFFDDCTICRYYHMCHGVKVEIMSYEKEE